MSNTLARIVEGDLRLSQISERVCGMILAGDYVPKNKTVCVDAFSNEVILANLEAPVLRHQLIRESDKAGPHLRSVSLGTKFSRFVFNLANNHIMDFGDEGLSLTCRELKIHGIVFGGAGVDVHTARRSVVCRECGKSIGIVFCCERQFGGVGLGHGGVAVWGDWVYDEIAQLKSRVDFVIVSCHCAFEYSPLPSPQVRVLYRRMIDCGADVIHGHHSHVPQGYESYHGGLICYGMGNFVVDPQSWYAYNHLWSLLVHLDFSENQLKWTVEYAKVEARGEMIFVSRVPDVERNYCRRYIETWNHFLTGADNEFMGAWQTVCANLYDWLYGSFLKTPRYRDSKSLTLRNRMRYAYDGCMCLWSALLGHKVTNRRLRKDGLAMLNFFQCETHRDVICTYLELMNHVENDLRGRKHQLAFEEFNIGEIG